jgi:hypothetical protein
VVIDTGNFYGDLAADTQLTMSARLRRFELFAGLELVHFEFVQNATLKGTETLVGPLSIGASLLALERRRLILSPYARVVLPSLSGSHSPSLGGELGLAAELRLYPKLTLHGVAAGDVSGGVGTGPGDPRGGALLLVGVQYSPSTRVGLALDLSAHFGRRGPLDYFAPALALRVRLYRALSGELAAIAPLAGADRHLVAAVLRIRYRF